MKSCLLLAPILLLLTFAGVPLHAQGPASPGLSISATRSADELTVILAGERAEDFSLFVALSSADFTGSLVVPYAQEREGSTVVLPFKAATLLVSSPRGDFLRQWAGTRWGPDKPSGGAFTVKRSPHAVSVTIPSALAPVAEGLKCAAYAKDVRANDGWGNLVATSYQGDQLGEGDRVLRGFFTWNSKTAAFEATTRFDRPKPRIYQFLPRIFGNQNEARRENGTLEQNGCGKFADLDANVLASLRAMGFTHVWPTGILQQATATDYSAIGEPADDPDLLKGLAGSPYAIRDYFDVSPDYARDPARRLDEFQAMVTRAHEAGLKVIIDFVPNHVARSHKSSVRPDVDFGKDDDRSKFFDPKNNFYWLGKGPPSSGKGPPLRLPTVDAKGQPVSPTCRVATTPADGLFEPEKTHGRVTGNNLASWEPDAGSWYETVKLNYGFDFTDRTTRSYPHGEKPNEPIPDTWIKMDAVLAYWQALGVDGFRVDMAHMVPPEFWHWAIARARTRQQEVFFAAEAYDTDPAKVPSGDPLVAEAGGGNVMFELLNAGFDAVYDDATYDKLKDIYEKGAWANDLDQLGAHPLVFDNSLRYAENHDEVRLAAKGHWGDAGMEVGRPVTALLLALSRGSSMLYSGQEVGEPAAGVEGFGGDDGRTSIFDYWSMPEICKWVNGGAFDGGRLSPAQSALRAFYGSLLRCLGEPAFQHGDFFPLNPSNISNPRFARLPGETASGHWVYAFLRRDSTSGQAFLVLVNLHPTQSFENVSVELSKQALDFLGKSKSPNLDLKERLDGPAQALFNPSGSFTVDRLPPLTPCFFEIHEK